MFFWGGKHLCICLSYIDHDTLVLDYISSGCIFAIFLYRRVDGKLLSMKNVPFFRRSLTLHRSSWTVADMSINSSKAP
jgi:hypothetical protein